MPMERRLSEPAPSARAIWQDAENHGEAGHEHGSETRDPRFQHRDDRLEPFLPMLVSELDN